MKYCFDRELRAAHLFPQREKDASAFAWQKLAAYRIRRGYRS